MVLAAEPLNQATAAFLQQLNSLPKADPWSTPIKDIRAGYDTLLLNFGPSAPTIGPVTELLVPSKEFPVRCRLYKPDATANLALQPVVIYYHGGGHVQGSLDGYDPFCRILTDACGAAVLAVDYRLGPEHPFPAAVEDAYAALRWVIDGFGEQHGLDSRKIAICGDSAGGHLTIASCLMAKKFGLAHKIAFALTLCPVTDFRPSAREKATASDSSVVAYAEGHLLTLQKMMWFADCFCSNPELAAIDRGDPRLSPVTADLSGLPKMLVVTAGYDLLRDEGEAFARKAKAAGSPVQHVCKEDEIHIWWMLGKKLPQGLAAIGRFGAMLGRELGIPPRNRL